MSAVAMKQIQKGSKRLFKLKRIELVESSSLYCIRLPAGGHSQNIPRRTAGVELNCLQQAGLPGIVLPNEEVQAAQSGKFEFAKELESGDAKGWNHG